MTNSKRTTEPVSDTQIDEVQAGFSAFGSIGWRVFNPQPEPPAIPTGPTAFDPASDLKAKGFNPQPEPPAKDIIGF